MPQSFVFHQDIGPMNPKQCNLLEAQPTFFGKLVPSFSQTSPSSSNEHSLHIGEGMIHFSSILPTVHLTYSTSRFAVGCWKQ